MSEDFPTLGTPITRMLYAVLWKGGGLAGYQPATPEARGSHNRGTPKPLLVLLACAGAASPLQLEGDDLLMVILAPCVFMGSLTAMSHLSPVVAWAVAHQLGNQGNNLQRNTRCAPDLVRLDSGWTP